MSRAVVSNVQVLTAGTRYDQEQAKDGKPIPSTVVTLLVTPEDAERIALAQNCGSIMLTLRNPLDIVPTEPSGVRLASLMGTPDAPPGRESREGPGPRRRRKPVGRAAAPAAPKIYTVEAIRAAKRSEEVVRSNGESCATAESVDGKFAALACAVLFAAAGVASHAQAPVQGAPAPAARRSRRRQPPARSRRRRAE